MAIWNYKRDTREQVALTLRNLGLDGPVERRQLFLDPKVHRFRVLDLDDRVIARFSTTSCAYDTACFVGGSPVFPDGLLIDYETSKK